MMHPCRRLLLDIYFFERKSALRWWLLRNSIVEMIKLRKDYMEFVELVWGTRQMMLAIAIYDGMQSQSWQIHALTSTSTLQVDGIMLRIMQMKEKKSCLF